jgi:hypothetical protein
MADRPKTLNVDARLKNRGTKSANQLIQSFSVKPLEM